MSRRSSNAGGTGVSLFPFLSILACLIGLLTLMIKIISDLKAIEHAENNKEETARVEEHAALQKEIKKNEDALNKVQEELKKKSTASIEMSEIEQKRIVLRKKLAELKEQTPDETDESLQKKIETMIEQIASLKKERPSLEQKIAELMKELEARKIALDAPPPPVIVQPRGSASASRESLHFIECNANGVVIMRQDGNNTPVSLATITTDAELIEFFNKAKTDRNAVILFLIRTDGNAAYQTAAGWAENQFQLRTAKLPIPNKGEIDISRFAS